MPTPTPETLSANASRLASALAGVLLVFVGAVFGVQAEPLESDPPARQAKTHAEIDQALALEEARCYRQFAVNPCLGAARAQARTDRNALEQREAAQKAAARQEATEAHRRTREQRSQEHDATRASANARTDANTDASKDASANTAGAAPKRSNAGETSTSTSGDAARAAEVQRIRQEQAVAQNQRDARAARARSRTLKKRAAAQQRQASVEQRKKDRQADGKVPAAPLPGVPAP